MEAPNKSRELPKLRNNNNRLGHSKYPRGTSSRALQVHKSNKLLKLQLPQIFVENSNRCNLCNGQEHKKCSSPSLSNPTKATNAMGGEERKNTKSLQDSPH